MHRHCATACLVFACLLFLGACDDTRRGAPWFEQLDGGVDAPEQLSDVPDTTDARPDIDVPEAPDCTQSASSLPGQVKRLADAEAELTVEASSQPPKVSPDGCFVAFEVRDGGVRLADLTGDPAEWRIRDPAARLDIALEAVAFSGPEDNTAWFGASDGSLHLLDLEDFSRLRSVDPSEDLTEDFQFVHLDVSAEGRFLAWSGRGPNPPGDVGGVYDRRAQESVRTWETSAGGGAPIEFVPGRALVIVRTTANAGQVELFDPAKRETLRTFSPRFGGSASSVWAATQTWFAIVHDPDSGPAVSRFDFETEQMTVVDPNPRQSHYHDLYVSPSGRWLLEWNFEHPISGESDAAILRYDMTGERPPLEFGPNLLGFGPPTDLVFSNVSRFAGIQMYDPGNGESLGAIGSFSGREARDVTGITANRLAVYWMSEDASKLSFLTGSRPNQ